MPRALEVGKMASAGEDKLLRFSIADELYHFGWIVSGTFGL